MSESSAAALNSEYLLSRGIAATPSSHPIMLDFGCGQGGLVALGLARNIDIFGVDSYQGNYREWSTGTAALSQRIRTTAEGRIPFEDSSFDVVISNQVFEHIRDPRPSLAEIARVLKAGGVFIAIFPHKGVWFEGHVGLYFPHWLAALPRLQAAYLKLWHRLGFGYYRDAGIAGWMHLLKDVVFYHRERDIAAWWTAAFGQQPTSLAGDWMAFRLAQSSRLRALAPVAQQFWAAPLLAGLSRVRAGLVLKVTKRADPVASGSLQHITRA
jgi:SAM-dependent methyltransferase